MATGVWSWDATAANNSNADASINWAEGQAPSTINDSARSEMAGMARYLLDTHGALTTTGAANTYSVTTNSTISALRDGLGLSLVVNVSSTDASTLNVHSLGAKAIKKITDSGEADIGANELRANGHYIFHYDASANSSAGAWILLNPTPTSASFLAEVVDDTTPQLGGMLDVNDYSLGDGTLELMKFSETASAVNEITIANAATGSGPTISATGDDANVDLNLSSKGTALVKANAKLIGVNHVLSKSANYTVVKADHGALIKCDATSAAFTITLPPAATAGSGFEIAIKKTDAGANAITIDGDGSETIDGATTLVLAGQYDAAILRCDGSSWEITSSKTGAAANSGYTTSAKTTGYTVTSSEHKTQFLCNATSGAFTVTLPAAATVGDGFQIGVKKTDSGSNAVTIDGNSAETIDGATTKLLESQFAAAILRCDGSNWHIIASENLSASASSVNPYTDDWQYFDHADRQSDWVELATWTHSTDVSEVVLSVDMTGYVDMLIDHQNTRVNTTSNDTREIAVSTDDGANWSTDEPVSAKTTTTTGLTTGAVIIYGAGLAIKHRSCKHRGKDINSSDAYSADLSAAPSSEQITMPFTAAEAAINKVAFKPQQAVNLTAGSIKIYGRA